MSWKEMSIQELLRICMNFYLKITTWEFRSMPFAPLDYGPIPYSGNRNHNGKGSGCWMCSGKNASLKDLGLHPQATIYCLCNPRSLSELI